jgi:multidrug efflux pump subunit AcrA (membrane-fusion protein)
VSVGVGTRGRFVVPPETPGRNPDKNVVGFRDVKIGVGDGDIIQIESGLKEGDKVVLNLGSQIASVMRVDANEISLPPSGKH